MPAAQFLLKGNLSTDLQGSRWAPRPAPAERGTEPEAILRELAYVLHLSRTVKESLLSQEWGEDS